MRHKLAAVLAVALALAGCGGESTQSSSAPTTVASTTSLPTTTVPRRQAPPTTAAGTTIAAEHRTDHDAAVAFVAAWRDGDVDGMRAVAEPDAVDAALRHRDPSGPTDCRAQPNGQFECLVNVAGGTRVYFLIGEPGAPEGRVWWVARYVPDT